METKPVAARDDNKVVPIHQHPHRVSPIVALRHLYELLEAYAPMWYTEEAHSLARAALGEPFTD